MEEKYENRLTLIRKMHEEEITEIHRLNELKEQQLEQMAIKFQTEKVQLIREAQKQAKLKEKEKRAKFQEKVEMIKRKEVDEYKNQLHNLSQ